MDPAEVARRADELSDLAEEVMAQRAADRVGDTVEVLIEEDLGGQLYEGRAAHQAPEVDGVTTVGSLAPLAAGRIISAKVAASRVWTWWPTLCPPRHRRRGRATRADREEPVPPGGEPPR